MSLGAAVLVTTVVVRVAQSAVVLPVLPPAPPVSYARPGFVNGPARPVYRHSIVPGGVYSAAEVQAAMLRDPVVAAHYAKLDQPRVVGAVLERPRAVYLSYRIGHRTMWTAGKVVLPAGEQLLTDGTRAVRARCGNLVSDTDGDQGVADVSGERIDPAEFDQQLPALVARRPDVADVVPGDSAAGPVLPATRGPGPFFQAVAGALPSVLGDGGPPDETPFGPFGPPPAFFGPTTTTGVVVLSPPSTTTTGTAPPPPTTTTTGVIVPPTTTNTTGMVPPTTTTTTGAGLPPTGTTDTATTGTVPEPSRLALLVLAWLAFRYRRRPR